VKDILQHLPLRCISCLLTLLALVCTMQEGLAFFSSLPDSPPPRNGYLTFQAPPKLRFHEVEPQADRRKLLSLQKKEVSVTPPVSSPSTPMGDSFPLISYDGESNQSSPTYEIPLVGDPGSAVMEPAIPPIDPFVSNDLPEPNLNNTDELMEILESSIGSSSRQSRTLVDFVPPYTMDGGNLLIESKTKYTRKLR